MVVAPFVGATLVGPALTAAFFAAPVVSVIVVGVPVVTALVVPPSRMLPVTVAGRDDERRVTAHAGDATREQLDVALEHRPPLGLQRHGLLDVAQDR